MARARSRGTLAGPLGSLYNLGAAGDLTDGQLLDRFVAPEDPAAAEAAFEALLDRHGAMVLAVCLRELRDVHEAYDAFQATFLVLVSKAATIRRRDSVGGWLFEIARRVSARARFEAARRRRLLKRYGIDQGRVDDGTTAVGDEAGDGADGLFDEVQRLPERYRAPVVLHYLEGLSTEATAQRLGCPRGTVLSRLSRARDRLRERLERRGASQSALVVAAMADGPGRWLTPEPVPSWLNRGAIRAARSLGLAGGAIEGAVTARVAGLSRRVVRTLTLARAGAIASLLLLAVAGITIVLAATLGAGETPPDRPQATAPQAAVENTGAAPGGPDQAAGMLLYRGRVVDPDGKAVAGARIYLRYYRWADRDRPQPVRAISDRDGRFRFDISRGDFDRPQFETWRDARVVVMAVGYPPGGSDSRSGEADAGREVAVRLGRDDVPVAGRLIDLEGRPVAGAKVRVASILGPTGGDLTPWLKAVAAREGIQFELENAYLQTIRTPEYDRLPAIPPVTTDPDGRFTIRGIGRDRLIDLSIEGPNIRRIEAAVMTRAGRPVQVPYFGTRTNESAKVYQPARFEVAAPPSRPIEGIVRDRDTGAPIAGATIRSFRLADKDVIGSTLVRATTDASGQFRMTGMPIGKGNEVVILPPGDQPYLPSHRKLEELTAAGPLRAEFTLKRGVWVEGKVTDRDTGRPVGASLRYAAAKDNPHLAEAAGFDEMFLNGNDIAFADTAEDGTYRVAALPGRGILVIDGWDGTVYSGPAESAGTGIDRGQFVPHMYQGRPFAEITIQPGRPAPRCDLALIPTRTVEGVVLDPRGRPIAGARVSGWWGLPSWSWPLESERFRVYGLTPPRSPSIGGLLRARSLDAMASAILPERPRILLFQHEEKMLAGWAEVTATTRGPMQVRLQSWGTIAGRLVDRSGEPRAHFAFQPKVRDTIRLGDGAIGHHPERIYTDAKGRFRVEGLVPGMRYRLMLETARGVNTWEGPSVAPLGAGEVRELNDVTAIVPGEAD